jgi:iron complex outermembrane receptor protein
MAQTQLPPIRVTAPSPIARPGPAPAGPQAPSPGAAATADQLPPGWLAIVADQFATVTVVTPDDLMRTPGTTLGGVLFARPGITGSSFAPGAASRPIVRGLDNFRVRIQENGVGVNDVSDFGEDHAVPVDPLAARRVEVIRGPATLRWGSQAIGGVVNVDNNRIPDALPVRGFAGEVNGAVNTVDNGFEGSVLLDAGKGNVAVHADAYARRAQDYRIPSYPYLFPPAPAPLVGSRQPNSSLRTSGQSIGGSYLFDGGFIGGALSHVESLYRVPGIEATETNTRIDMRQFKLASKGEVRPQGSAVDAVRFWLGASDYTHHELANESGFDGIQQTFTNRGQEGRVEVQFAPIDLRHATLTSALGVQSAHQKLTAPGAEGGLFDPNRTVGVAGYLFNELALSRTLRMQLAGRVESVNVKGAVPDLFVDPDVDIARDRTFTPRSAAAGLLQDLPHGLVASLTAQYVERAPRAPELLSRGVHEATETFDIGNPNLKLEAARTVEIGLRRARGAFRFEATAYDTKFAGFIFRRLTGETCDEDFASCTPGGAGGDLNQAIYTQRDATFRGAEFQAQLDVGPFRGGIFGVEGQYDIVRARFSDGSNVPRIPPQRVGGGLYWRDDNWFARVGLLHAFDQNRIAANETPTAGYNLLRAELSHTRNFRASDGPRALTVGVVGNNLLDDDVRNHVSFKKDEVLLPGRSIRFFLNLRF